MGNRVSLFLGAYYHPPVAWRKDDLEEFYNRSVKPFTQLFYNAKHPFCLYFSGPFLDWIEQDRSVYKVALSDMLKERRLELLGGGYSAPLLPLIPHNDRIHQIELLTTLLRKATGKRPRGLWLTRGVWEESLPGILHRCGLEYTFLPSEAFFRVGVEDWSALCRPCLTESQGEVITILPYDHTLANEAWAGRTEELWKLVRMLASSQEESPTCLGLFHNGQREIQPEAASKFLQEIQQNQDLVEVVLPGNFLKKNLGQLKHRFFPTTGFKELRHSGADLPSQEEVRSRSSFKQILSAYAGFNQLYTKMIHVSSLCWSVKGDRYRKRSALDHLVLAQDHHHFYPWEGICNLNPALRSFAMGQLISAEQISRGAGVFASALSLRDFDLDGRNEYMFRGATMNLVVSTRGSQIIDWDLVDRRTNLSWAPSFESEENRRYCLADYLGDPPTLEELAQGRERAHERLWTKEFRQVDQDRSRLTVELSWRGLVATVPQPTNLKLDKSFVFQDREVKVRYRIQNLGPEAIHAVFGPEFRLNLNLKIPLQAQDVREWVLQTEHRSTLLTFTSDLPFDLYGVRADRQLGDFYRLLFLLELQLGPGAETEWELVIQRPKRRKTDSTTATASDPVNTPSG